MKFRFVKQKRGMRLMVDKKHFKTIPKNLSKAINKETINKMGITGKRLSVSERELLMSFLVYHNWIEKLAVKERHLYNLINKAVPVSKRKVITLTGERLELVLDNNLKIKVPDKVYDSLVLKETQINSNF